MPELPDITVYAEALRHRVVGRVLERISIRGPSLLRSVEPPIDTAEGRRVIGVERLGKRIVLALESDLFLVIHLMIAGRLRWHDPPTAPPAAPRPSKIELARFRFESGTLVLTEAGTKKRASLHLVRGRDALHAHDPGGIDVLAATAADFAAALRRENHTIKRALTDPRLFDGIGNAYSDEILHAAKLSPIALSRSLTDEQVARLLGATRATLTRWTDHLRREFDLDPGPGRFPGPGEITAFRPGFAVHGKFAQPCPVCATKVARIVHAENETNYCPACQTGGRLLKDRSLSRLLRDDWPRSIDDAESHGAPGTR